MNSHVNRQSLIASRDVRRTTNSVTHNERRISNTESPASSRPTNNKQLITKLSEEFFFSFLVILLIILIYGLFQKDPGFGFYAPYWKMLDLILALVVFLGILASLEK